MKEFIYVPADCDQLFRETCDDLGIHYFCIQELLNANRYEVLFDKAHDLFVLGMNIAFGVNKAKDNV